MKQVTHFYYILFVDLAGHAIIPWMWHDQAAQPMNIRSLGYTLGETFAPLIAANFLLPENEDGNVTTNVEIPATASSEYVLHRWNLTYITSDVR